MEKASLTEVAEEAVEGLISALLREAGLLNVMESGNLEILHWQGLFDSYIVKIFWIYVDFMNDS